MFVKIVKHIGFCVHRRPCLLRHPRNTLFPNIVRRFAHPGSSPRVSNIALRSPLCCSKSRRYGSSSAVEAFSSACSCYDSLKARLYFAGADGGCVRGGRGAGCGAVAVPRRVRWCWRGPVTRGVYKKQHSFGNTYRRRKPCRSLRKLDNRGARFFFRRSPEAGCRVRSFVREKEPLLRTRRLIASRSGQG